MNDINELRNFAETAHYGHLPLEVSGSEMLELLDRLEAAEKEREIDEQRIADLMAELNRVGHENDALRAKITEMEKQEPVGWFACTDGEHQFEVLATNGDISRVPLYALPGAQNVPSVPEGWKLVPDKHPTFDPVDLQLADGSVLCGCLPQSDGDYWWKGPSGEVFIDPKYASVTHWRLAETPKPEGE